MQQDNIRSTIERISLIVAGSNSNSHIAVPATTCLLQALQSMVDGPEVTVVDALSDSATNKVAGLAEAGAIREAKLACRSGNLADAAEVVEAVLLDEGLTDIREKAIARNHLGVIRRMQRQYRDAGIILNHALIDFKTVLDHHFVAESLNNLGLLHFRTLDFAQAQSLFDKSQAICSQLHYNTLLAFVFLNKTEFFSAIKDYDMAAQMCIRGLRLLTRLNLRVGLAKVCLLMGHIFWKCGHILTARDLYLESISLYKAMHIPLGLANCCSEFSVMLHETGAAKQAEAQRQEARRTLVQMQIDEPGRGRNG